MLASFLCGEFFLHIPRWLHFYLGSFSYTSRGDFIFMRGLCLTLPMMTLFLCGFVSLTHPVLPSFMMLGVSLTHPVLSSFLCREFLLHIPCWLYYFLLLFYIRGVSLTHPMLTLFLSGGVSVTHPVLGSFLSGVGGGGLSYTSRAGFNFMRVLSLTHPITASFLSEEFLLHIQC